MSFRTVMISSRCKLDLRMNYLEVRSDETKKILLDDIDTLIIENPAVSITGCLLSALMEKKIKVIFCDNKRNPQAEMIPYYGSYDCSRKIKTQIAWEESIKGDVWTKIVEEKIRKQAQFLQELGYVRESELLFSYTEQLEYRDETNREGHAAKVYFNALFRMDFTRNDDNATNAALNYGYALILSAINREVVALGYNTELGLFHDNIYNPFNISCDIMEPLRILIDRFVYQQRFKKFEKEEKHKMLEVLQLDIKIGGTRQVLTNGIRIYVRSVFDALCEKDTSMLLFYEV